MKFLEAYEQMKRGKTAQRIIDNHRYMKVRKLKIINNKFRMFDIHHDWNNAVQVSIEDLDATDWEVVE